jgi:acyl-CoA thioesterase-1
MNWLVFHLVSGHVFFTGIALLLLSVLVSVGKSAIAKRVTVLAFIFGVIAIVVSTTPIPYWIYALAIAATVVWIVSLFVEKMRYGARIAMIAVWCLAAVIEIPYHIAPRLSPASSRAMTVIGDSVTAGVDEGETTWPHILATEHALQVQDISHVGETTASALKRAQQQQIDAPLVFLEIGGNDVLGTTSTAQFSQDLDALLSYLEAPNRQIIMFELPVVPLWFEYARVQRAVARKHRVRLVPKRVLLSILLGDAATLDSIHLTQSGQQRMADRVWKLVRSAFPKE